MFSFFIPLVFCLSNKPAFFMNSWKLETILCRILKHLSNRHSSHTKSTSASPSPTPGLGFIENIVSLFTMFTWMNPCADVMFRCYLLKYKLINSQEVKMFVFIWTTSILVWFRAKVKSPLKCIVKHMIMCGLGFKVGYVGWNKMYTQMLTVEIERRENDADDHLWNTTLQCMWSGHGASEFWWYLKNMSFSLYFILKIPLAYL